MYLHFNFLRCLFLVNFSLYSYSSRTFQVRRLNETSYIVTTMPEVDDPYNIVFEDNIVGKVDDTRKIGESDYDSTITTVKVGDKSAKPKKKISALFINKARDNYFKKYYATTKRPSVSSLFPEKVQPYLNLAQTAALKKPYDNVNSNLEIARKLASILIAEVQIRAEMRRNVDNYNRNKRFKKTTRVKIKNQ